MAQKEGDPLFDSIISMPGGKKRAENKSYPSCTIRDVNNLIFPPSFKNAAVNYLSKKKILLPVT